ncbi:BglG family transcription antiterminator [Oceanobacillus longus]|uniref:Ascorbate-specific PTS system EIIA component n=1 Tax=Oceanobacillus longus TaxID=930120 RepID=A0ABV8H1T6_9BACI
MFDQRSYKLFEEITKHDQLTKQELMRQFNLTERQLNYDLQKVNDVLSSRDLPELEIANQLIVINKKLKKLLKTNFLLDLNADQFLISEQDRAYLIYLYTFIRNEPVSNYHFQILLSVSKNTALTDVKRLKDVCENWNTRFLYTRSDGYHIEGNEMDRRRLAMFSVNHLLSQPLGKEIIVLALKSWGKSEILVETQQLVDGFLKEREVNLVKSRKSEMIVHLAFIKARNRSEGLLFNEFEKQLLERQSIFKFGKELAHKLLPEGGGGESYFVTIQLLIALQEVSSKDNPTLEVLAGQIIDEFEKNTLLPIKEKEFLKQSLFNHLVPAFIRITFEIPLVNPLTQTIKSEYTELFHFVERSLAPLSLWTGKVISEAEIGYFTIHFGGFLERDKKLKSEKINGLIVCSNGLSSSIMLEAQLKDMFPEIHFTRIPTGEKLEDIPTTSYDVVFSTVNAISVKPVFIVKPLLSQVEKNYLIQSVVNQFPRLNDRNFSVDQLMEVIKKHTEIKDENKLFSELVQLFYSQNKNKGAHKPMLSELLTTDTIQFTDEDLGWKDAILQASQPLVESNKVQQKYVDAMITNVEEIGTYIHIGKGIAIPHARPENGVNQLGMSFLRTKKPVFLLGQEAHKIDIFICLAAIDSEAHLKALAQLTRILGDDELLNAIKDAETAEQVIEIIKKGESK